MQKIIILFALLITSYFTKAQSNAAMEFVENKGQWNNAVKYKGLANAGEFYLLHQGFKVVEHRASDMEQLQKIMHAETTVTNTSATARAVANYSPNEHNGGGIGGANHNTIIHSHAYEVSFVNASPLSTTQPEKPLSSYNNYFIGNDQSKWANNCKIYTAVTYTNIYPNIDVRYYTNAGTLKYDIIVHPGGDVNQIAMRYDGVDGLKCKRNTLYIKTSLGETQESLPISYTRNNQTFQQKKINCAYKVEGNIVRFSVEDDYDKNATLVIDPTLVFSTLTGSRADNWGYTATYGPDGSFYAGGIVFDNGFPTTNGAYQTSFNGGDGTEGTTSGYDIGIVKYSPNGQNLMYGTYIGGSSNEQPHSLVVDKQGNLFIAGRTSSNNYPTTGTLGPLGRFDIIITKLNSVGNITSSIKIGGTGDDGVNIRPKYIAPSGAESLRQNYGDDARSEIILDNTGNVYVASCTRSSNFPTNNGLQTSPLGNQDGVLIKLTSNLNILFSTYLGGSGDDAAYVLAINPTNNNIYVAGGTTSRNISGSTTNTLGEDNHGGIDGFISIFNNAGTAMGQSTYIGTNGTDQVYGIQFDKNGFLYIMGTSTSAFPVKNAPYSNAGGKQFIAKLKPDLSDFVYSTVFGTNIPEPNLSPIAFLVDRCENVYVSGWGGIVNLGNNGERGYRSNNTISTKDLPTKDVPTGSLLRTNTDGSDLYFFILKRDATDILHGSFFGQVGGAAEHVDGGTSRFDKEGIIYQAVCAACRGTAFPTTPGVWSPNNGSRNCNLAAVKINFDLAGVAGEIKNTVNGVANDTIVCIGTSVTFEDIIRTAKSYTWDFRDGTVINTTSPTISHIFTTNGRFRVRLIARDPTSCNLTDTTYITIKVGDKNATPKFTATRQQPCETYTMQFQNTSIPFPGTMFSTDTAFGWDFGDGSDFLINGSSTTTFNHRYPGPGTYNVKLVLRDTIFCNVFDTIKQDVVVTPIVKANLTTPASGCVPYTAAFTNTTVNGDNDYRWDFGDGQQLTQNAFIATTNHTYTLPGTYPIKLVARNSTTCNLIDSFTTNIIVSDTPRSSFTYTPVIPIVNTPHVFNNTYAPILVGDSYLWDFGDGETYSTTDRNTPVTHQYNATATFNACLTVTNSFGCKSTFCLPVQALIRPESDVPNAFTPGRFGVNSILKVDGYGIGPMTFRIFNRWGQKVFETNNRKIGWDGNFNGKPQPMDVYTYTLDILYTDSKTKKTLTGDITLIR